jgi:hypothetical protein
MMLDAAETNIRLYVDRLYEALMQTGMYSTHFSAKPRSSNALKFQADGKLHSDLMFSVTVDVCAKPPSKKRLVCWLYKLLRDIESGEKYSILDGDHIPREWLVRIIEQISKQCDHREGQHHGETDDQMGLHLVQDCFDDLPPFVVGSAELKALTALADQEADLLCCDVIHEVCTDRVFVSRYGMTNAADMLFAHKKDGRTFMEQKELLVNICWQDQIRDELYKLAGGGGSQP